MISGTGNINKIGAGSITLAAANTFSGILTISSAILYASNNSALGQNSAIVQSGASIGLINSQTIGIPITINGLGVSNLGAISNKSQDNQLYGNITLQSGSRIGSDLGKLTLLGNILCGVNSLTFISGGSGIIESSGVISGSGGVIVQISTGQVTLNGLNTFTGGMSIWNGIVNINTIKNFSSPSSIGADSTNPIQIGETTRSGTLNYQGVGDTTDRTVRIGFNGGTPAATDIGTGTILSNGTGNLIFSAANFNIQTNATTGVGAGRTLTLGGSSDGQISGIIRDNLVTAPATGTAFISLVKSGAGKWTLSGANTFSGPTTVNAGYLIVANASALGTIATATTVNSGGSLRVQGGILLAAEPLTISGSGSASDGALANFSGTNSMSGAISMAADARINSIAGSLTISGAVNGATRTLTLGGAGTLTLSGIITLTTGGIIYDGAGILILSKDRKSVV